MNKKLFLTVNLIITLAFVSLSFAGVPSISKSAFIPSADLIVTDIWIQKGIVYYNISNIGNKEAGSSISTLQVDGNETARDYSVPSLAPGKEITRSFLTYRLPFGTHKIAVVADSSNFVFESEETNNCKTKIITWKLM
jgi:subtilase family serine protease